MFLTEDEISQLTGKTKHSAQIAAAKIMGIEYRVKPDGSIAILRSHIEKLFDGMTLKNSRIKIQPNWEKINAKKKKT